MANIKVTPETLNEQGEALVGYAGDLEDILSEIDKKINEIIDGWEGLAQGAYYDMYTSLKTSLDEFPQLVNSLGESTMSSAKEFDSVDSNLQSEFNKAVQ